MIELAAREAYFNHVYLHIGEEELWWHAIGIDYTYKDVKFHQYVFKINGKIYPWCTEEFKEEFHKAKTWQVMKG